MIVTYNKDHVGDVLLILLAEDKGAKREVTRRGRVARIFNSDTGETLAWNIFEASSLLSLENSGQVILSADQVAILNDALAAEQFDESLIEDTQPKFVVAEIAAIEAHPDSDHLHICQVNIGNGKATQIVCGAPNARQGLQTIAALPGAMMPDGTLIFPGKLRGVDSYGMLCSARELGLQNVSQERGIIELAGAVIGEAFDPEKHWRA